MNELTTKTEQNTEITIDKIIDFALKNGKRFEAYSNFMDRWNERAMEQTFVGIELKSNIWFWWSGVVWEGEAEIHFCHRYNQTNGHIMKSFAQKWKAEDIINGIRKF